MTEWLESLSTRNPHWPTKVNLAENYGVVAVAIHAVVGGV
jgi:hypothetical protein